MVLIQLDQRKSPAEQEAKLPKAPSELRLEKSPAVKEQEAKLPKAPSQPHLEKSPAVKAAINTVKQGGYDFDREGILDRKTPNVFYFVGDYHSPEFRQEVGSALHYLVQHGGVRRVGLEGVWGEPRPGMLDDRYREIGRIVGHDNAKLIREAEKPLFEPVRDFIEQKVKHGEETIQTFGLESKDTLLTSTFLMHQQAQVRELLNRMNTVFTQNPDQYIGLSLKDASKKILGPGGDAQARAIEDSLLEMNKRIDSDAGLKGLIGKDTPRYTRGVLDSAEGVTRYQIDVSDTLQRFVLVGRDLRSVTAMEKHAAKNGNTAFSMGWYHTCDVPLNVSSSAIVVHPVKAGHALRKEYDPAIAKMLEGQGVRPFSFLR